MSSEVESALARSLPVAQMFFNDSLPNGAVSAGGADVASLSSLETARVRSLQAERSSKPAGIWGKDLFIDLSIDHCHKSTFSGFFSERKAGFSLDFERKHTLRKYRGAKACLR